MKLLRKLLGANSSEAPFANKTCLITGCSSGIGRQLCLELGRRGATVIATGRDLDVARGVAEEVTRAGGRAEAARIDVRRVSDFTEAIEGVVDRHGRLDYFFNNAGVLVYGDALQVERNLWERVLEVNLRGAMVGTMEAYRVMAAQGSGHIVNVSSGIGLMPVPAMSAYAASKHGVVGMSLSLRLEAARRGVKVSVVCPGYVKSAMLDKAVMIDADKPKLERLFFFRPWETDRAVARLLRGVERNEGIIVFPGYTKLFWAFYRHLPGLYLWTARFTTKDYGR